MMNNDVKAVILAGGEGRRLRPLSFYIQKTMIPIGPYEKPLLEYIIRLLALHGVRRILVLLGYKGMQVINYFGDGSRLGVEIKYSFDDEKYRGSGGALLKAYVNGLIDSDRIIVYYGDILSDLNVRELLEHHSRMHGDVTLVVTEKYQVPVGVAYLDNNGVRVESLVEKPWLPLKATMGVLVMESRVLGELEKIHEESTDIMGDFIPHLIKNGYAVNAYVYNGEWYDVGSIERYEKINQEWLRRITEKIFGGK